jgi:hypothetical protein
MKPLNKKQAAGLIADILANLLGCPRDKIHLDCVGDALNVDFEISSPKHRFAGEYKTNATTVSITSAVNDLTPIVDGDSKTTPLIIVPFMGNVGRRICEESQISWLDLSGNAKIVAAGLRIWIQGHPNKFAKRGRPPNAFAPKSSRIARQLLALPTVFQSQAEIARRSGLGDGYVSRIISRLREQDLIEQNKDGVRPSNPDILLDAWHAVYDFNRSRILKGHVAARTGNELQEKLAEKLRRKNVEYAMSGLGAAWLYTQFAAFRLTTIYLSSMPSRSLLDEIEFSEEPRGANLWIVIPDDNGVFNESQDLLDIQCVSPLQTYLDLKSHPERAKEAAGELRTSKLRWKANAT